MTREEDIDLWYDEQKERLSDKLAAKIKKGRAKDRAKKWHADSMRALNRRYTEMHAAYIRSENMKTKITHFINMKIFPIRSYLSRIAERFHRRRPGGEGEAE